MKQRIRTLCMTVVLLVLVLLAWDQIDQGGQGARLHTARAVPAAYDCAIEQNQLPTAECSALVALYESTNGPAWTDHTDWLATDGPCSWYGVTCDNGQVQALNLNDNQLSGSIPPELGNLSALQQLYLYTNQLSGALPSTLGNLNNLQILYASSNQLSGSIPAELGNLSNLQLLYLDSNQLSCSIPPELGNLSALQQLYLSNNQLSGGIPPELGNLSVLEQLYLHINQLSGSIPPELGNLSALQQLYLYTNQLSGPIPAALGNLNNLQVIYASSNQLSGSIPAELGNLSNLQLLYLDSNQLSGSIPAELGNLSALQQLYLSTNLLSGSIPLELGNLSALQQLYLSNNQLSGTIPPELGTLSNLQLLYLHENQLSGGIPPELGNLSALQQLYLYTNQLSGPIPAALGNLNNLQQLYLSDNQLSGAIPPELGSLSNLQILYLNANPLGGSIPTELGNLSALQSLDLSENQLVGSLPSELGNLTQLFDLALWSNPLGGALPLTLVSLTNLTSFSFFDTGLCISDDAGLQAWLAGITSVNGTEYACDEPAPAPPVIDVPGNPSVPPDEQAAAYQRLQAESETTVTVRVEEGTLRFASFQIPIPQEAGDDPVGRAEWFLNEYSDLLALNNPAAELQLIRSSDDGMHHFFRQLHNGIPVFAGELALHMDAERYLSLNGEYVPHVAVPDVPEITAEMAEATALATSDGGDGSGGDTQLRYVDLSLLGIAEGETYLTWQVNVTRGDPLAKLETVFVDAFTGAIVFRVSNATDSQQSLDLDLEDGNDNYPDQLCGLFDDDNIGANEVPPESVNANNHFHTVYNYWRGTFGRDSYDNDEEQAEVNIHVQFRPLPSGGPNTVNASYGTCDLFFFARNTTRLDITGHEWTHAVDNSEGGLIYANQSGALDESFADIFGYMVDPSNFLIGENSAFASASVPGVAGCSATPASRDLSNPPCHGDPDHMLAANSGDGQGLRPAVANPNTANDNGGVHTNSGINNKAAYLIIQGGTVNGILVQPIGRVKAQHLFYNVLVNRVTAGTTFQNMRDMTVQEAIDLANTAGVNGRGFDDVQVYHRSTKYNEACTVRNAYAAVGIGNGDINCDGIEDNVDPDADGDWIPNGRDNCPNVFNPGQDNLDGDSMGDACDPDMDNDGRANAMDNCPRVANPGWADWNNNGFGDACDDTDGDSVLDATDNCREVFNPGQENLDKDLGDRLGDACDPDIDGDLWINQLDNCPVNANFGQEDTTEFNLGLPRDGIGDACDLCPLVSSADNTDLDGDGLANPCDDDDDGDGWLDGVDNCPLIANADQFDWDENDIGFVCDPQEQEAFGAVLKGFNEKFVEFNQDFIVPVPICPDCGGVYVPKNFESVINVGLDVQFQAAVVNGNGDVVAKTTASNVAQVLNFNPAPFSKLRAVGAASTSADDPLPYSRAAAADELRYYLIVEPVPGTDMSQPHALSLALSGAIKEPAATTTIFLPLVRTQP